MYKSAGNCPSIFFPYLIELFTSQMHLVRLEIRMKTNFLFIFSLISMKYVQ